MPILLRNLGLLLQKLGPDVDIRQFIRKDMLGGIIFHHAARGGSSEIFNLYTGQVRHLTIK